MQFDVEQELENVNGHRESRLKVAQNIIVNHSHFGELLHFCFEVSNPKSYKASWVIEFVVYEKPEWFTDYYEFICYNLKSLTDEKSIRPWAKIIQVLIKLSLNKSKSSENFTESQINNCIEIHFDWLILDKKVATKAYAMRTLFILGEKQPWIRTELQQIISKDYADQSAAYKAVAREILKKLK